MSLIMKKILIIICMMFLFGCEKKTEETKITMLCKGTTYITENSSNWEGEKVRKQEMNEVVYVIYDVVDMNHKDWVISLGDQKFDPINFQDKKDGSTNNSSIVVNHDVISYTSKFIKEFGSSEKKVDDTDRKHESIISIQINRISGLMEYENFSKTTRMNGSWFTRSLVTKGNCEKGSQKS